MSPSDYEMIEQGYDPPRSWPTVEDATRRINVLIEGQVEGSEADMAARDLIVLMREIGRVAAENGVLKEALRQIAEGQMVGYEAQTIARAALKAEP